MWCTHIQYCLLWQDLCDVVDGAEMIPTIDEERKKWKIRFGKVMHMSVIVKDEFL